MLRQLKQYVIGSLYSPAALEDPAITHAEGLTLKQYVEAKDDSEKIIALAVIGNSFAILQLFCEAQHALQDEKAWFFALRGFLNHATLPDQRNKYRDFIKESDYKRRLFAGVRQACIEYEGSKYFSASQPYQLDASILAFFEHKDFLYGNLTKATPNCGAWYLSLCEKIFGKAFNSEAVAQYRDELLSDMHARLIVAPTLAHSTALMATTLLAAETKLEDDKSCITMSLEDFLTGTKSEVSTPVDVLALPALAREIDQAVSIAASVASPKKI